MKSSFSTLLALVRTLKSREKHRLIREKLDLPQSCGIYLITTRNQKALYLGRTGNLRRRLRQHLLYEGGRHTFKKKWMKEKVLGEAQVIKKLSTLYMQFLPCDESQVKRLEHLAIAVFEPKYND